jgi:hypothetical protein
MYWLAYWLRVPELKPLQGRMNGETGLEGWVRIPSHLLKFNNGDVAHQVEQQTENLCVVGSSPTVATSYFLY